MFTLFILLVLYLVIRSEIDIYYRINYENRKEECHSKGQCIKGYYSKECIDCNEL